jgi:hypothetical protein
MKPNHYFYYFSLLLIIGTLLATCCISEENNKNVSIIPSAGHSQQGNNSIQSPAMPTPFIIINPIVEHHRNETFEINGTTNLGVKEKLRYSISRHGMVIPVPCPTPGYDCHPQYIEGAENITFGEIPIVSDGTQVNKWSFMLNTSDNEYYQHWANGWNLNVSSQEMTVHNSTDFFLQF